MPDVTSYEPFAIGPDTQKLLTDMGHHLEPGIPINQVEAIIVGAPSLGGKPVGANRFYGANDPRHNTGQASGY
jgi:gamma-glutamyltranspeptidase / glutathione hydrolase